MLCLNNKEIGFLHVYFVFSYQVFLVFSLSIRTLCSLYLVSIHSRAFGLYFRKLRMVTLPYLDQWYEFGTFSFCKRLNAPADCMVKKTLE